MQVSDYIEIVKSTDQFSGYDLKKRRQISLYGLVGEIGSLTSAVKKAMLAGYANPSNDEVVEEIGDVFWYLFNLITILGIEQTPNVLKKDIVHVRKEVTDASERGEEIREVLTRLDGARLENYEERAEEFLALDDVTFSHYQKTAYLTARTEGHVLNDVCLAVLWQLGAELLRQYTMPSQEWSINKILPLRDPETVIGEIAWHLAAIASVHEICLNEVVKINVAKANFRSRATSMGRTLRFSFPPRRCRTKPCSRLWRRVRADEEPVLAALVPPPRFHLLRYHGVLAPRARARERIVPAKPVAEPAAADGDASAASCGHRLRWATLLARVFSSDLSECAACGGRLRIIAALTDPASIRTCLEGVGLPAWAPPRAPPEPLFEFAA